jgi:hypothetical protein
MRDGKTDVETMTLPLQPIAEEFLSAGLVAAIRGAQTDTIRYRGVRQTIDCGRGVIAYWTFLTGKKVIYFGRRGETHVENFPVGKS